MPLLKHTGPWTLVLRLVKRFRFRLSGLFVLLLLNALLKLPVPFLTIYIIDHVLPSKSLRLLSLTIAAIMAMSAVFLISEYVRTIWTARTARAISAYVHMHLLKHVLALPVRYFSEQTTGYVMARFLDDAAQVNTLLTDSGLTCLQNGLTLLFGIGAIFYINWQLALASLAIIPPFVAASLWKNDELRRTNQTALEKRARVSQILHETLEGISTVKIYVREKWQLKQNFRSLKHSIRAELRTVDLSARVSLLLTAFVSLGSLMVLCAGSFQIMRGALTIGELLAFNSVLGYLYGPSRTLATTIVSMQRALASIRRVSDLLEIAPEEQKHLLCAGAPITQPIILRFDRVSFGYSRETTALNELTFSLGQPGVVAVAGRSGAGKSSIVALLMKLHLPGEGRILINERDLAYIPSAEMRCMIGYVDHSAFLYNGTIRDNITLGRRFDDSAVARAAEIARAAEFIGRLPDKYHTAIGSRGMKLSSGERQRIALARAIVGDPPILILDEANSAVDSQSEELMWQVLAKQAMSKIIIVVSHRLASLRYSERILLLENGRIVANGPPDEVCHHRAFKEMFASQLNGSGYDDEASSLVPIREHVGS